MNAGGGGRSSGAHAGAGGDGGDIEAEGPTDEQIDQAWDELYAKRSEWSELPNASENFLVQIRGGRGTKKKKKKGVAYDCAAMQARGALPSVFVEDYGLQKLHSFSILKYGESTAMALALEVAARHDYFFGIFMRSDELEHRFSEEEISSYKASDEWRRLVHGFDSGSSEWTRAKAIEAIRPCLTATQAKVAASSSSGR